MADYPCDETMRAVYEEVLRARTLYPDNKHLTVALMEEVGELAQVQLDDDGRDRAIEEAKQVACLAIRIMEEGDADFAFQGPDSVCPMCCAADIIQSQAFCVSCGANLTVDRYPDDDIPF
jgi:hypothetical protein